MVTHVSKRLSFFKSLFTGTGGPDREIDPYLPSREYCQRLLSIYEQLKASGHLVSPLPDWIRSPSFTLTIDGLQAVPRLQAALADCTAYTPGKWLLEKELGQRSLRRHELASTVVAEESPKTWEQERGDVYDAAQDAGLSGLAFSGGGIRSATFCLGVLQSLASHNEIPRFDYLSSVSGGGYIHQWFASWVYNQAPANSRLASVQKLLKPLPDPGSPARWPAQILWLRRYSSYLTPQRGFYSADTWTMICIWFRNTFLNQIVLLGFLATCILAIRLIAEPFFPSDHPGAFAFYEALGLVILILTSVYQLVGSIRLALALYSQRAPATPGSPPFGALNDAQVVGFVVLPSLVSAYGAALQASFYPEQHWFPASYCFIWALQLFFFLIGMVLGGLLPRAPGTWQSYRARVAVLACLTALLISVSMGYAAHWLAAPAPQTSHARLAQSSIWAADRLNAWLGSRTDTIKLHQQLDSVGGPLSSLELQYSQSSANRQAMVPVQAQALFSMFAPLIFLSLQFLAIRLQVGILGNAWAECRREWMARLGAWTVIASMIWFFLGFTVWISPTLCGWVIDASNWHRLWAAIGVIALHAVTLYAGASGKSDGQPKPGAFLGYKPIDLLGMIGAPLCVFSLLIVLAGVIHWLIVSLGNVWHLIAQAIHFFASKVGFIWLAHTLAGHSHRATLGLHWLAARFAHATRLGPSLLIAVCLSLLFIFFAWRVDVNEFSIHGFYRNRLARCYLGATNTMRMPDPFTKFDEHNETAHTRARNGMSISDLLPTRFGGPKDGFDGPFPIFCSTLNLTFGEDLAYQERKGASFAFTPLYSGYHVGWTAESSRYADTTFNGYVPTRDYAYRSNGVPLASAAAISGAALSPNQGYSSQPALAFLMTLFNVRLGWWIANPRKPKVWTSTGNSPTPSFGLRYLLAELFGRANDTSKYICLCDGGKFENMGLYELVRRRCTFIVICDAESDADYEFEGIGGAISKCRTDFGAEITLDLRPLRRDPITNDSQAHFVEGTITYPAPPGPHRHEKYSGRLFYVKSAVVGDEPGDILHHKLTHANFPNDTTINQWFTESQFESYRRLGQLSGEQLVKCFPGPMAAPLPLPPVPHMGWSELISWIKRH
jgi:hypothetical protein